MTDLPRLGRLHVLTDETVQSRFTHAELARLALAGGAAIVQFREKRQRATAALVRAAVELLSHAQACGARLIVNDRVDVAAAAGADGVHLGAQDLDPRLARRLLGPAALIGGTANSLEQAQALSREPLDYLGVGPVFGTMSKSAPAPVLGLAELGRIARAVGLPVIAIGGITAERVASVLEAGAYGVAVLSAVACAADPAVESARLREAVDVFLGGRSRERKLERAR